MYKIGLIYLRFAKVCAVLLVGLVLIALAAYWRDSARLSRLAVGLTAEVQAEDKKIATIADYVSHLEGNLGDEGYFLSPVFAPLKPSACQIIDEGGDCAFKARAFIVLMNKLDIDASKLCLHDVEGVPRHAVALVASERGPLVADLSYGILYAHEDGSPMTISYIAEHHADIIKEQARRGNRRAENYPLARYPYHHVTTINWEKGVVWRSLRSLLGLFMSEQAIGNIPRPYFSEEPALMIIIASGVGLAALFFPVLTSRIVRRLRRRRDAGSPVV